MKKMEADEINEVAALENVVSETSAEVPAQVIDEEDLPEEAAVIRI